MCTAVTNHPGTHTVSHQVNRLIIDTDATFDDLRHRYEALVPEIDLAELTALIDKGSIPLSWSDTMRQDLRPSSSPSPIPTLSSASSCSTAITGAARDCACRS